MSLTFDEFKDRAAELLNINLDGYKIKRVKRRTDSLMRRHDVKNYSECLELLQKDPDFKALYLGHFTINTSEFFRNPKNFEYLKTDVLPPLLERKDRIKIWSAPCSNGSEPYTVAIILNELGVKRSRFKILASDLDPDILEIARRGVYGQNSLKNVPPKILDKYFNPAGKNSGDYKLSRNIISQVTLEEKDLIYDKYQKDWDIILSRNFFIYLTKELKDKLTEKFASVLNKKGYLFLGNTEFIFNAGKFGLKKEHFSFYRKD